MGDEIWWPPPLTDQDRERLENEFTEEFWEALNQRINRRFVSLSATVAYVAQWLRDGGLKGNWSDEINSWKVGEAVPDHVRENARIVSKMREDLSTYWAGNALLLALSLGNLTSRGILCTSVGEVHKPQLLDPIGPEWWIRSVRVDDPMDQLSHDDGRPYQAVDLEGDEIARILVSNPSNIPAVPTTVFEPGEIEGTVVAVITDIQLIADQVTPMFPPAAGELDVSDTKQSVHAAAIDLKSRGGRPPDLSRIADVRAAMGRVVLEKFESHQQLLDDVADELSKSGREIDVRQLRRDLGDIFPRRKPEQK